MRQWAISLVAACAISSAAWSGGTSWLESGHPRITVMFARDAKYDCGTGCDRYELLLMYRTSPSPTVAELSEWSIFAEASCLDVVLPARKSFACRVPGSIAGQSRNGQRYATSHFHVHRAQLDDLLTPAATLRLEGLIMRLPDATRVALQSFLQNPVAATP